MHISPSKDLFRVFIQSVTADDGRFVADRVVTVSTDCDVVPTVTDYDAVVFDNDGVLVELTPMDTLRGAVREAFADVGVDDPDPEFVELAAVSEDIDALERVECRYDVSIDATYGREPTVAGAHRRKPDTDYLDRALSDLGTRDALYVGDSETDVETARRAGVDSAFLRRPHRTDATLSVEPTDEFDSLAALVDALGDDC